MKKAAHSSIPFRHSLVAAALACGFGGFASQAIAQAPSLQNAGEVRYIKGRILVQPRAGLSTQEFDKKIKAHGGRRVSTIPRINVHVVELPARANERAVAQLLRSDRHIKFAELDVQVTPPLTPNDQAYTSGWHLPKLGLPSAWDYSTGEGVTIAILDTGVDASHPDLAGSLVPGYNAYDGNSDTRDVHGHGTKSAGSAAMAGNNLIGGTGVAYKARIMPIRISDTSGMGSLSAMARGLVWAADNGARVANNWSCYGSSVLSAAEYFRSKGGVVTGSAGNSGIQESYAPTDAITCVSAVDGSDTKASWSSYGPYVDMTAPGVGIYTTTNGGGYGAVSGTSFSAPITAGVYALMMAANRSLSPAQLDQALFSSAVDLGNPGPDSFYGYGRVDAAAALAKVRTTSASDTTAPTVSITSPAAGATVNGLVAVDVNASDNTGVARVELYADGRLVAADTAAPYAFSWDAAALTGGQVTLEAKAVDTSGNASSHQVTVAVGSTSTGTDVNTGTGSGTTSGTGGTGTDTGSGAGTGSEASTGSADAAPVVSILQPAPGATITDTAQIGVAANDDRKVVSVTLTINGKIVATAAGATLNYAWNPKKGMGKRAAGSYNISATAVDDGGNVSSQSISVDVK